MAKTITIEITDSEYRCLEYITENPSDFVDNATTFRARAAKDEILPLLIAHCNEKSIALASMKLPYGQKIKSNLWVEIYALRELEYYKMMKKIYP